MQALYILADGCGALELEAVKLECRAAQALSAEIASQLSVLRQGQQVSLPAAAT